MQAKMLATLFYQVCLIPIAVYEKGVCVFTENRNSASLIISGDDPLSELEADTSVLNVPQLLSSIWNEHFIFLNAGRDIWFMAGPFSIGAMDATLIKSTKKRLYPIKRSTELSKYLESLTVISEERGYYIGQLMKKLFAQESFEKHAESNESDAMLLQARQKKNYSIHVKQAIRYIDEHLKEYLSAKKIAASINVNKDYLSTLFKKETGTAMMVYIQKRRSEEACELLKNTGLSIKDIAKKFQFSSASHFASVFKKHFRITPIEYRKKEFR